MWNIHIANVEDQLLGQADHIKKTILRALKRSSKVLSPRPLDIVVMVSPYGVIPELGHGGYCSTDKLIQLVFQPQNKNFGNNLQFPLERLVTHELHHSHRSHYCGLGNTLGDLIVMEGLACQFVKQIYDNPPEPWEAALDDNTLADIAFLANLRWKETEYNKHEWYFGNDEFPRWALYSLGYALIGKYLELNPTETAASLVGIPANTFQSTIESLFVQ